MRFLYNIFFVIFAVFYLPYFLLKGKYHKDLRQRFGIFDRDAFTDISSSAPLWVHAVSVGEMKTAEGLMKRIRSRYPSKRFVISNVTQTGHGIAASSAGESDMVIYFPVDLSFVVRRLVRLIKPSLFIAIETEIWPNLITELNAKSVPVVLVNGRISGRSFRNYKLIKRMIRPVLDKISLFCMRTEADALRIKELGAFPEKVHVTGNMKFDGVLSKSEGGPDVWPPIRNKKAWLGGSSKLMIAGSTHRGEDASILRSFKELKKEHPDLSLLIAPRHIERSDEVSALTKEAGLDVIKMSEVEKRCTQDTASACSGNSVFLLDSIGHLSSLYELATVVFMGGSLVPHGGQNFIEAAAYAKPVITGPFVHNFKSACELFVSNDAIEIVRSGDELLSSLRGLLSDDGKRKAMGQRAREVVLANIGSTDRNISLMEQYL